MPTQTNEKILRVMDWMIQTLQFHQRIDDPHPNEEWGLDPQWSPPMKEAMDLYEDIKAGRIIAMEAPG